VEASEDDGGVLTAEAVEQALDRGLAGRFTGERVLAVIPDHTRSLPLPWLFRRVTDLLGDSRGLQAVVALGTHPPLDPAARDALVGRHEHQPPPCPRPQNHAWQDPEALTRIGTLTQDRLRAIAGERWHPSLGDDVPVRINRLVLEADRIVIVGPTFPHEVAGFSGGAKYLFPGLSGPEMIDVSHWLGALGGVLDTIGVSDTPVRSMIHAAADMVDTPVTLVAPVVVDHNELAGMFIGDPVGAWRAATDLSARRHVIRVDRPFERVLSWAPPMYDELWTAAKAAYKLEPVVAPGGELIVYAPHLAEISRVHGRDIRRVGYHVLDYFLAQWDSFSEVPLAVLAHSTHLRGAGTFVEGVERPRATVTLASRIPREECERIGLGYADPASIRPEDWQDRESEGVLFVPRAGETLYRLR
jgi:nickel-dependent lactate racemase